MSQRFRISHQADADLDHIVRTIGSESSASANDVLDKLYETFLLLASHPEIGTAREDLSQNIRMFSPAKPASSYVIFYYTITEGIEISDVIHGARDWLKLLKSGRGPND